MKKEIIDRNFEANNPEEETVQMLQEPIEKIESDFEANTEEETFDSDFEPRQVGEENAWQSLKTQSIFESLILAANKMKPLLDISMKKAVSLDDYLSFLKSKEPEKWIYTQFIEVHNITFNNLSTEKIIELRLLDITGIQEVLTAFETFQSALKNVQTNNFFYPLSKLWNQEENEFKQNAYFWEACDKYYSRFTFTKQQNQILEIFEKISEQLNELVKFNILRPANGPAELNILPDFFKISRIKATEPYVVDAYLFSQHRLSSYRTKGETLKIKKYAPAELFH